MPHHNKIHLSTDHESHSVAEGSVRDLGGNALNHTEVSAPNTERSNDIATNDLDVEMDRAIDVIFKIQDDPSFLELCNEKNVDPKEFDNPRYWHLFAPFVHEKIKLMREKGADGISLDMLELAAWTPLFFHDQRRLDHLHKTTDTHGFRALDDKQKDAYHHSVLGLSRFNSRIRSFAEQWNPQAFALGMNLQKMIPLSVNGKHQRENARQKLGECIRGAQHEVGFAQILRAAGLHYREATAQEDAKGIDLLIDEVGYSPVRADVKASLHDIHKHGGHDVFTKRPDGKVIIYSMIHDSEFVDGRFTIDPAAAAEKAAEMPHILQKVRKVA